MKIIKILKRGNIFCPVIFGRMKKPFVYIIRKRAIGDVLWIEPVIRELSSRYRRIIVFTKYNQLFENYPLKNITFKSKLNFAEKLLIKIEQLLHISLCTIDLNMSYEKKPRQHILKAYFKKSGIDAELSYPRIFLSEAEKQRPAGLPGKYAVLHIESFSIKNYRKVYGIDWNMVVDYLRSSGYQVIQIGIDPPEIASTTVLKTSIREMISLIAHADLFIGLDSGPSHIAASLHKPSVLFFGAINPDYRHIQKSFNGYILQAKCEYQHCYHESVSTSGPSCRLIGDEGIPKCCIHSAEEVISCIGKLEKKEDA